MTDNVTRRRPRTRRRIADETPATEGKSNITQAMRDNAQAAFHANKWKNHFTNIEKKAREALYRDMQGPGSDKIASFNMSATCELPTGNKKVMIETQIVRGEKRVIDLDALRKEVGEELFMECISASVKAIEEKAGKHVLDKVSDFQKGEAYAKVKASS